MIKTDKPIVFFDIESTDTNTETDRIVELSLLKVSPDGSQEIKTRRFNPGQPIPASATKIHGISDADVLNEPYFASIARYLWEFMSGCHYGGYNAMQFDIPMLAKEFERSGIQHGLYDALIIDPMRLFEKILPKNLKSAYRFFCGKDLNDAHSAEADTLATYEIFRVMRDKHCEVIGNTVEEIAGNCRKEGAVDMAGKIIKDEDGIYRYNFGKDKGKSIKEEPSFGEWMLRQSFITEETKNWVRKILGL